MTLEPLFLRSREHTGLAFVLEGVGIVVNIIIALCSEAGVVARIFLDFIIAGVTELPDRGAFQMVNLTEVQVDSRTEVVKSIGDEGVATAFFTAGRIVIHRKKKVDVFSFSAER